MLKVKTRVQPSPIHGLGLFADQAIVEGEVIWEFTPGIDHSIPVEKVESMEEPMRSALLYHCCEEYEDASLPYSRRRGNGLLYVNWGDIRFTNFSHKPNTREILGVSRLTRTVARRFIPVGEEITADYREFDARWRDGVPRELWDM